MKKNNHPLNETNQMIIPKTIHSVWMTWNPTKPEIPEEYKENYLTLKALHPDWNFMEWDDAKTLQFVSTNYPELLETYISYDVPVKRHDACRYLILKHFGGVFIQHSMVFQKNIEPLLQNHELVFSTKMDTKEREDELANGFIASIPHHEFWNSLIAKLPETANLKVMSATGPFLLTATLKEYQKKYQDNSIKILDNEHLFPFYFYDRNNSLIKENCTGNSNKCFEVFPDSYAYTPWNSAWNKDENKLAKLDLSVLNSKDEKPLVFIINLNSSDANFAKISQTRWEKISKSFDEIGLEYERFEAVNGYNVKITDPETGISFTGLDVKNKMVTMPKGKFFDIECDNGVNTPVNISVAGYQSRLMAGNIGVLCSKTLIREIIKEKQKAAFIFEDDFTPNPNNFLEKFNQFIKDLPLNWDIAYLNSAYVCNINPIEKNSSVGKLICKNDKPANHWGDWAHAVSYPGAIKLTYGNKYIAPSDIYSNILAQGLIKKPFFDEFNTYFAVHNFSAQSYNTYTGHSINSISTKMGCRDGHKSDPNDCIANNQTSLSINPSNYTSGNTSLINSSIFSNLWNISADNNSSAYFLENNSSANNMSFLNIWNISLSNDFLDYIFLNNSTIGNVTENDLGWF